MSRQQLSGEIAYQEGPGPDQVHRWRAFAVLAVSFFMTVADLAIVNVALPTIGRKLHMPESSLQWVVTGYALTFGGFLLLGGRAADLLGRRRILMVGLALFTAASLGCGLATSDSALIPMRCLQGLGAAIVLPAPAGLRRLVYAGAAAPQAGWGSARTVTLLAASVALLIAFVVIETRVEAPLMPLRIFRSSTLAGANAFSVLLGGSFFAFIFIGTLYMQQGLGDSAL